jgi:hypothetical protein
VTLQNAGQLLLHDDSRSAVFHFTGVPLEDIDISALSAQGDSGAEPAKRATGDDDTHVFETIPWHGPSFRTVGLPLFRGVVDGIHGYRQSAKVSTRK